MVPRSACPRPQFEPHFSRARAAGLHSVPHAGETTGPQTVWDALEVLGAERIGHGTSSVQDPDLLAHLVERPHPAGGVPDLQHRHPARSPPSRSTRIRQMYDAGVVVTVNSDDPPMFGTSLNREYEIAVGLLGLDRAGWRGLARNAVHASYAPEDVKQRLLAEIGSYCD